MEIDNLPTPPTNGNGNPTSPETPQMLAASASAGSSNGNEGGIESMAIDDDDDNNEHGGGEDDIVSFDTIAALIDGLRSDEFDARLTSATRIGVIGNALGEERVRTELVPFLR
jgi:hypothetical protein